MTEFAEIRESAECQFQTRQAHLDAAQSRAAGPSIDNSPRLFLLAQKGVKDAGR